MRGISGLFCLAGGLLVILSVGALAAPTAQARSCPGKFQGDFFFDLTTRKASCATGRDVLRKWVRRSGFGTGSPAPRVRFGAWTCRLVMATHGENPAGRITCRAAAGRRVRFYGAS